MGNHQSSLPYYLGQQKAAFPVIADQLLGNGERARKLAREQQTTSVPLAILDFFARKSRPAILGDDSFRLQVRHQLPRQPAAASRLRLPGRKRPALSRIVASVATVFTVSEDSIVQAARGPGSKNVPRWVAMHLCQEVGGVTLQVIADHFGLQRYGTVSTTIGKLRDELLNETLFTSLAHAREKIAAWVDDYNTGRPHSALGYATPAAFAAQLKKQGAASLRIAGGYATQPLASPAHMGNNNVEALIKTG